ncbi:hypothetical protein SCLCIDRAFT_31207 [Scleroderma citrinum Foug A]|uniref:Uncharacterized protein n=1 Tax=Scleroderma citrinum Foug A TaxID=1036808 RepID=A0A0C2ZNS3_9AGAM|nr:hypothetical protein SCLCIDRAFT_31207 [Scleroderma citrinum Foug A]
MKAKLYHANPVEDVSSLPALGHIINRVSRTYAGLAKISHLFRYFAMPMAY